MDGMTASMARSDYAVAPPPVSILPLRLENVYYAPQGVPLIDNVNLTLNAGDRTVVLGPNGAGKSLLQRLCHGLIAPTSGRVVWSDDHADTVRDAQAMVFQRPVLLRRSVAANVDFGLKLRGVSKPQRKTIVDDVLNRTGLSRFADGPARRLSGGEQQKLALARAWALRPQVLFLDEPTASLDPAATHGVEQIIRHMVDDGTRIVMVTHDMGQARRIADDVLFMYQGRLLEHTSAATFFNHPQSTEAAAFLRGELRW